MSTTLANDFRGIFEPTRIDYGDDDRLFAECVGGPFNGAVAEIKGRFFRSRFRTAKGQPFLIALYTWANDHARGILIAKFQGALTQRQFNRWLGVSNRRPNTLWSSTE